MRIEYFSRAHGHDMDKLDSSLPFETYLVKCHSCFLASNVRISVKIRTTLVPAGRSDGQKEVAAAVAVVVNEEQY